MPLGRLPLSITNHSMLLGRLPQAVTSHGMLLGRLPLSITNHSLLLGHLPQAITSGSMPLGRLPLSTWKPKQDRALEMNENQSLPLGRMPLSSLPLFFSLSSFHKHEGKGGLASLLQPITIEYLTICRKAFSFAQHQ